jgi:hypothetical protein
MIGQSNSVKDNGSLHFPRIKSPKIGNYLFLDLTPNLVSKVLC